MSPYEWQEFASTLFGYYNHQQIVKVITQEEFICSQELAVCENNYELIEALKDFHFERN